MPGHYDKYPDGSWQQLHDQIQEAHDKENETKRKKAKKAGKILKDYKKKKPKNFVQKLFDKLKIKPGSGGGRVGGGMPLTNMDLKRPRKQTKVN